MKKTNILIIALFVSIIISAQTSVPNLLVNGDFEPANWTNKGGPAPTGWTSENTTNFNKEPVSGYYGIAGTQSLRIGNPAGYVGFYQDITLEAGATYSFGCTGRLLDAAGPSGSALTEDATISMEIRELANGIPAKKVIKYISFSSNTDLTKSSEIIAGTNTTVRVTLYKSAKIAYLDNIFVQKKIK